MGDHLALKLDRIVLGIWGAPTVELFSDLPQSTTVNETKERGQVENTYIGQECQWAGGQC